MYFWPADTETETTSLPSVSEFSQAIIELKKKKKKKRKKKKKKKKNFTEQEESVEYTTSIGSKVLETAKVAIPDDGGEYWKVVARVFIAGVEEQGTETGVIDDKGSPTTPPEHGITVPPH